jgi:hypothetical protein
VISSRRFWDQFYLFALKFSPRGEVYFVENFKRLSVKCGFISCGELKLDASQALVAPLGDRTGRIFAYWVIVFFCHFL